MCHSNHGYKTDSQRLSLFQCSIEAKSIIRKYEFLKDIARLVISFLSLICVHALIILGIEVSKFIFLPMECMFVIMNE